MYWDRDATWYPGRIVKYKQVKKEFNPVVHKHRIDYDDGDHDWLVLADDIN